MKKRRHLWMLSTGLYMALMMDVLLKPKIHPWPDSFFLMIFQNFLHLPAFGVLTYLLIKANNACTQKDLKEAVIIAFLYGVFIEYLQGFMPGRVPSFMDIGINATGILLTITFYRNKIPR